MNELRDDVSYWKISPDIITQAWLNVVSSLFGYALFGTIVFSMFKNKIIETYKNNILLILIFAFITDLLEIRINIILIGAEGTGSSSYRNYEFIETTLAACTLARFSHYSQFLVTFVEAALSLSLFLNRIYGKSLSVSYVYAGIGSIIIGQIGIILATFWKGFSATTMSNYCIREYLLPLPVMISIFAWALSTMLSPVLCLIMIFKGSAEDRKDGITAYILSSSLCMSILVISFIIHNATDSREAVWLGYFVYCIFAITRMIQEVRFLILTVLASLMIPEIRAAVSSTVSSAVRKVFGYPEIHVEVTKSISLDDLEANAKNAIPEVDQELIIV